MYVCLCVCMTRECVIFLNYRLSYKAGGLCVCVCVCVFALVSFTI